MKNLLLLLTVIFLTQFAYAQESPYPCFDMLPRANETADMVQEGDTIWTVVDNGLALINRFDNSVIDIITPENSPLPNYDVTTLAIDQDGYKWIGYAGGYDVNSSGLAKFKGDEWIFYDLEDSPIVNVGTSPSSKRVYHLFIDQDNVAWMAASGPGLFKFDGETWTHYTTANSALESDAINVIRQDYEGNMWIGQGALYGTGAYLVKIDTDGNWTVYDSTLLAEMPQKGITDIAIRTNNEIWMTTNAGVGKLDGGNWTVYTDLPTTYSFDIDVDAEDNIYIGHAQGYLSKVIGETWETYESPSITTPNARTLDILADSEGKVWYSAWAESGLYTFDTNNQWAEVTPLQSGLESTNFFSMYHHNGVYWFGSFYNTLASWDGTNWKYYDQNFSSLGKSIEAIGALNGNLIFVGEYNSSGALFSVNENTGELTELFVFQSLGWDYDVPELISINEMIVHENTAWVASNGGLIRYDGEGTVYATETLPSFYVNDVDVDENGVIWAATNEGIGKYDGTDWVIEDTTNSNLPNNNIKELEIVDGAKWIVTGGDNKLYKLVEDEWVQVAYDFEENTILDFEAWSENEVWISYYHGVAFLKNEVWEEFPYSSFRNFYADHENEKMWLLYRAPFSYDYSDACVAVDSSTNVTFVKPNLKPSIYPNPTEGSLNIQLPIAERGEVFIYDLFGRLIIRENIQGTQTINVTSLKTGSYICEIKMADGQLYTDKLVIGF